MVNVDLDDVALASFQVECGRHEPVVGFVLVGVEERLGAVEGPCLLLVCALVYGVVVGVDDGEQVKIVLGA